MINYYNFIITLMALPCLLVCCHVHVFYGLKVFCILSTRLARLDSTLFFFIFISHHAIATKLYFRVNKNEMLSERFSPAGM